MTLLSISLLGAPEFRLGSVPIANIESDKTRALLAYIAMDAELPHRRETLTDLLWPDSPATQARHNLRQALHNLRVALREHSAPAAHLQADRHEVRFRLCDNCWLDVAHFTSLLRGAGAAHAEEERIVWLRQAVQLYRGEFLKGFHVAAAAPFDEWRMFKQEELHFAVMDALAQLAACHEQRCEYGEARRYLLRQLELEPWREEVHRKLMELFWRDGRHTAALHQYDKCMVILNEELAVSPDPATTALYERIRACPCWTPDRDFTNDSRCTA
jgi:DNA-binding SARP family transcriptional activator